MANMPETYTFEKFAARYCVRQQQTPEGLRKILLTQKKLYQPDGWFMLACLDLSSSRLGSLCIVPYGPNNTFKTPPSHPVSPGGLASEMSTVVAVLPVGELG
jgi:hypothetical protein